MRSVFQNPELFEKTYFKKFPGFYVTGDGKSQNKLRENSLNELEGMNQNPSCCFSGK